MRIFWIAIFVFSITARLQAEGNDWTFTILYNNYACRPDTDTDWGFSCLVTGGEKTILFDTGANGDILMQNIRQLNVDLSKVDIIVLSHIHHDHTGGLDSVLAIKPNITLYIPNSFPKDFAQQYPLPAAAVHRVKEAVEIIPNVLTTGEMGDSIKEQSLVFLTAQGQVILTGCSHQGIVAILEKAQALNSMPVYMVFGGFHLLRYSDTEIEKIIQKFHDLGVEKCGATHCTGDRAIELFAKSFKDSFVNTGVGAVISINND